MKHMHDRKHIFVPIFQNDSCCEVGEWKHLPVFLGEADERGACEPVSLCVVNGEVLNMYVPVWPAFL